MIFNQWVSLHIHPWLAYTCDMTSKGKGFHFGTFKKITKILVAYFCVLHIFNILYVSRCLQASCTRILPLGKQVYQGEAMDRDRWLVLRIIDLQMERRERYMNGGACFLGSRITVWTMVERSDDMICISYVYTLYLRDTTVLWTFSNQGIYIYCKLSEAHAIVKGSWAVGLELSPSTRILEEILAPGLGRSKWILQDHQVEEHHQVVISSLQVFHCFCQFLQFPNRSSGYGVARSGSSELLSLG